MATSPLYLLDTNILVHYVRGSSVWHRIREVYQPLLISPTPKFCLVGEGEIRSLAVQWGWAERKLGQMEFCLGYFRPQTIDDPDILRAYATIDAYCESIGQTMGKNDLWIAATAAVTGATIITTDRDFDKLTPRFLAREWIDPTGKDLQP